MERLKEEKGREGKKRERKEGQIEDLDKLYTRNYRLYNDMQYVHITALPILQRFLKTMYS